jgi:hypothetical protein
METYSTEPNRLIEDYYFKELENEMGAAWLIERLFSRGTVNDIKAIRKYYGDKRIKEEVIQIQWLSKESVSFFSGLYNIPKEEFLTYQLIHKLA